MRIETPSRLQRQAKTTGVNSARRALSSVDELIRQFPTELYSVALSLAAAIAFFTVMGGLYYATYAGAFEPFDLNGELKHGFYPPVIYAAGLLFATSWYALSEGRAGASPRWAWAGIAAFFAFMGIDELVTFHENLQDWTRVDWQLLYLPLVAFAGVFWLAILRAFSTAPLARLMWVGGVAAWSLAQVIELFEYDSQNNPVAATPALILAEEPAELVGSTLLLLAVLAFAHRDSAES